jgi:hypothetical protein
MINIDKNWSEMIDGHSQKPVADRRQSKFQLDALGRFDDECFPSVSMIGRDIYALIIINIGI